MQSKEYYIQQLSLQAHPEGGFYRETYRGRLLLTSQRLGQAENAREDFPSGRNISTAIYFMLTAGNFSAFHRIKSDELWHFYTGANVVIHIITPKGEYQQILLGANIKKGAMFQAMVPAGAWFASELQSPHQPSMPDYAVVGCTVAPGFNFADFELAKAEQLVTLFPQHKKLVERLTR